MISLNFSIVVSLSVRASALLVPADTHPITLVFSVRRSDYTLHMTERRWGYKFVAADA